MVLLSHVFGSSQSLFPGSLAELRDGGNMREQEMKSASHGGYDGIRLEVSGAPMPFQVGDAQ